MSTSIMKVEEVQRAICHEVELRRKRNTHGTLRALDVGCGTGAWTLFLAEQRVAVDALEPRADRRERLIEKLRAYPKIAPMVHVFSSTIETFPVSRGEYDVVIAFNSLRFVPPKKKTAVLRKLFRSMKENGSIFIIERAEGGIGVNDFSRFDMVFSQFFDAEGNRYFFLHGVKPPLVVRWARFWKKLTSGRKLEEME